MNTNKIKNKRVGSFLLTHLQAYLQVPTASLPGLYSPVSSFLLHSSKFYSHYYYFLFVVSGALPDLLGRYAAFCFLLVFSISYFVIYRRPFCVAWAQLPLGEASGKRGPAHRTYAHR